MRRRPPSGWGTLVLTLAAAGIGALAVSRQPSGFAAVAAWAALVGGLLGSVAVVVGLLARGVLGRDRPRLGRRPPDARR